MLTLQTFHGSGEEPSYSPFCVKAMCLLHMAGVDWKADFDADVRKAPNKKFPVLVDAQTAIADSARIRTHLEQIHGADFDAELTPVERAQSHALVRMAEENLYFLIVHERWMKDDSWVLIRKTAFETLPAILRPILPGIVRKAIRRDLYGQGTLRFTDAERLERAKADIGAIAVSLGDKPFLFGDAPSYADAAIAPMLSNLRTSPVPSPLREYLRDQVTLCAYIDRAREAIYPDLSHG
jgi:glutathione S-transferase